MPRTYLLLMTVPVVLLAACASSGPIVDTQNTDMVRYEQDLAQCEAYAAQVNTGEQAGKGAAGGAVLGALLGAIVGNSTTVARGAGVGGVVGGAKGVAQGANEKQAVVRNCLRGRGDRVLN